MSPSVPKLVRTMRMRCFCSLNADHERMAKGRVRRRGFAPETWSARWLKSALESVETPLEFELLACFFAALKQGCACSRGLLAAKLRAAGGADVGVVLPRTRLLPKALARQEAVFDAGPYHVFEVAVGERV